jgi:hypothetical protein
MKRIFLGHRQFACYNFIPIIIIIIFVMNVPGGPSSCLSMPPPLVSPPSPGVGSQLLTPRQDHCDRDGRRRRPSREDDHFFFSSDLLQEEIVFERQQEQQEKQQPRQVNNNSSSPSYRYYESLLGDCNGTARSSLLTTKQQRSDSGAGAGMSTSANNKNGQRQQQQQPALQDSNNTVAGNASAAWQKNKLSASHDHHRRTNSNSLRHLMNEITAEYGDSDDDDNDNDDEEDAFNYQYYCQTMAVATTGGSTSSRQHSTEANTQCRPSLNRRNARNERLLQEQYRREPQQQREEQEANKHTILPRTSSQEEAVKEEEKKPSSSSSLLQQRQQFFQKQQSCTPRSFATFERWDEDLDDDDEFEVASLLRSASMCRRHVPTLKTSGCCVGAGSETTATTADSSDSSSNSSAVSSSGFSDNVSENTSRSSSGNSDEHVKSSPSSRRSCSTTSSSSSSIFIKPVDGNHDEEKNGQDDDDDDSSIYHGAYFLRETRKWAAGETPPRYLIRMMDESWKAGQALQFEVYRKFDSMGAVEDAPHMVLEGYQVVHWIRGWTEYYDWYYAPCSWSSTSSLRQSPHRFKQASGHFGSYSARTFAIQHQFPPQGASQNQVTVGDASVGGESNCSSSPQQQQQQQLVLFDLCVEETDMTALHVAHDELLRYCQDEIEKRKRGFNMLLSRRVAYVGGFQSPPSPASVTASSKTIKTTNRSVKVFVKPMAKQQSYTTTTISPARGSSSLLACPNKDNNELEPKKTP